MVSEGLRNQSMQCKEYYYKSTLKVVCIIIPKVEVEGSGCSSLNVSSSCEE